MPWRVLFTELFLKDNKTTSSYPSNTCDVKLCVCGPSCARAGIYVDESQPYAMDNAETQPVLDPSFLVSSASTLNVVAKEKAGFVETKDWLGWARVQRLKTAQLKQKHA